LFIDPGVRATPIVSGPGGVLPAYVQFSPNGAPDAIVEAFSDASGQVTTRLVPGLYTVLVVPSVAGVAPGRITGWSSANPVIAIAAGTPITGVVLGPTDAPIQGAKVQLSVDRVPSTVATTAADGRFMLRATIGAGNVPVTVDVSPPAASGLPRLSATSQALDLRVPLQIHYAPALSPMKNLGGIQVGRRGAPLTGVLVTVVTVEKLADAGTVTAGTSASAAGELRIATGTDELGALPPLLVPSAALSAVVVVAPGDIAVAALDTRGPVPASLDAPWLPTTVTVVADATGTPLRGAVVDLVPTGALAMAAVPSLQVVSDGAGTIRIGLAAGGRYDLRFRDPLGHAAPLVVADRSAAMIEPAYRLPSGLVLRGTLRYAGTQSLANASVQLLCDGDDCLGIARARPLAEVVSNAAGGFSLAVPDPGTL
jgi:hypothetical protein